MSKTTNNESVDNTGSSIDDLIDSPAQNPNEQGKPGELPDKIDLDKYVSKDQYEDLEKKLGEQGKELGDYRTFIKDITPLMEKLEGKDEIVQAILDDKITPELAKAVLQGKVSISDATIVANAQKEVKQDLGKTGYSKASPEDIEKLISEKVEKIVAEKSTALENKINETDQRREFEKGVEGFILNTSDFQDYADDIAKFFEEHPRQYDIEVAYHTVKGKALAQKESMNSEQMAAEKAKQIAGNAAGGYSQGGKIIQDKNIVDDLISGRSNPNLI